MHLKKYLEDIYYTLYGMLLRLKWLWLAVISPICLIVPLLSWHDLLYTDDRFSKYFINDRLLKWLPVGIAVGMFAMFYEDMNGEGRELLYVSRGVRRRQILFLLVIYNLLFLGSYYILYKDILDYNLLVCFKCVLETVCSAAVIYALLYISRNYTTSLAVFVAAFGFSLIWEQSLSAGVYAWNYMEYSYFRQVIIMLILSGAGLCLGYQGELNYMGGKPCGRKRVRGGKDNGLQEGQEGRAPQSLGGIRQKLGSMQQRICNIWRTVYKFLWLPTVSTAALVVYIHYQVLREPDISEHIIQHTFTYFYPVLVMFFLVLVYQEMIEGAGRETVYLCQRMHLLESIFTFAFCCLYLLVPVIVFRAQLPNAGFVFFKYVAVLFCFCAAGYGICYLFRNITLMILGELAIYLVSLTNPLSLLDIFDWRHLPETVPGYFLLTRDFWLVGIAGLVIGLVANYKYRDY